jgi:hypothetical protein
MPSTNRRSVLACAGSLSVTSLGGCTALTDQDPTLGYVTVDIENGSDASQTFHVAVETVGGLGAWHSESLAAGGRRTVDVEPPDDGRPVAVHGFVDDRPVRIDFDALDLSGTVCPVVKFYYRVVEDDPTLFTLTADVSCS